MQDCQLDAVLLDFGGVLAEEGFAKGLKALARAHGRDEAVIWRAGLQAVWDSGYVLGRAAEAEFWTLFKERTGIEGDEAGWREDILSRFEVRPWMRALVDRLRTLGVITAILSDQTDWLELLDSRQGFFKHFDKVFNSFDHGLTKQQPDFFHLALSELGVAPNRVLFVDDNAGNVERARALGMAAVLFQDREGFERELDRLCPAALKG
jgi:putative hydrolase of the HAD superfamily